MQLRERHAACGDMTQADHDNQQQHATQQARTETAATLGPVRASTVPSYSLRYIVVSLQYMRHMHHIGHLCLTTQP